MTVVPYVHARRSLAQAEFVAALEGLVGDSAIGLAEGRTFRVLRLIDRQFVDTNGAADIDDVYRLTAFGQGQARWVRRQDRSGGGSAAWLGPAPEAPLWEQRTTVDVAHVEPRRGILWGTAVRSIAPGWTRFSERNVGPLDVPIDALPGQHAVATWDVLYEADEATGLLRSVGTLYRSLDAVTAEQLRFRLAPAQKERR